MGNDVGFPISGAAFRQEAAWVGSPRMCATGAWMARTTTDGTDTTPVVTETYIGELEVTPATRATGVSLLNGSAVAGNVTVILYRADGTPVAKSAATAQSGTAAYQRIPFSAPINLVPGTYYIGVQFNNVAARFRAIPYGDFGQAKKTGETFGTATKITPPTTFTANQGPVASLY